MSDFVESDELTNKPPTSEMITSMIEKYYDRRIYSNDEIEAIFENSRPVENRSKEYEDNDVYESENRVIPENTPICLGIVSKHDSDLHKKAQSIYERLIEEKKKKNENAIIQIKDKVEPKEQADSDEPKV